MIGITIGDEETYTLFMELIAPIISILHNHYDMYTMKHMTNLNTSSIIMNNKSKQLFDENVSFIRINTTRNFNAYSLLAGMHFEERQDCEHMCSDLFSMFNGVYGGEYFQLNALTQQQDEFIEDCSFLFEISTERTTSVGDGTNREYPLDRGIFINHDRNIFIWVNECEHLRMIVTEPGGDICNTFNTFVVNHELLELNAQKLGHSFMHSESLGYLQSNLAYVGTGMKISIMVSLPAFNRLIIDAIYSNNHDEITLLEEVCSAYQLTSRGSQGMHSASEDDKFDISNTEYLGECHCLCCVYLLLYVVHYLLSFNCF
jgi:protein-arginine kinase